MRMFFMHNEQKSVLFSILFASVCQFARISRKRKKYAFNSFIVDLFSSCTTILVYFVI